MKNVLKRIGNMVGILIVILVSALVTIDIMGKVIVLAVDREKDDRIYTENVKTQKVVEKNGYKEDEIPEEKYYFTIKAAMKNADIDEKELSETGMRKNIDTIIAEFENEDYKSVYFKEITNREFKSSCFVFAKFKIKEFNGEKKYAFLEAYPCYAADRNYALEKVEDYIELSLRLADYEQGINIDVGKTRFVWGIVPQYAIQDSPYAVKRKDVVEKIQIEGQTPDDVIEFENFGETWYFWYYEDLKSDKPASELEYTLGREK